MPEGSGLEDPYITGDTKLIILKGRMVGVGGRYRVGSVEKKYGEGGRRPFDEGPGFREKTSIN